MLFMIANAKGNKVQLAHTPTDSNIAMWGTSQIPGRGGWAVSEATES